MMTKEILITSDGKNDTKIIDIDTGLDLVQIYPVRSIRIEVGINNVSAEVVLKFDQVRLGGTIDDDGKPDLRTLGDDRPLPENMDLRTL